MIQIKKNWCLKSDRPFFNPYPCKTKAAPLKIMDNLLVLFPGYFKQYEESN